MSFHVNVVFGDQLICSARRITMVFAMPLSRLIYISENQIDISKGSMVSQLGLILSQSNRNNRLKNITGALVFDEMWFLQALEGDRRTIYLEYERIKEDERHSGVSLIELVEITERVFANWWMGFAMRTKQTEQHFAPFIRNGAFRADEMTAAKILEMMRGFAELGANREVAGTCSPIIGRSYASSIGNA